MNVARRLPDNTVNNNEPNGQKMAMTSAGLKTSFAYDMLIDTFEDSIIRPYNSICLGCDYRVPMLHGLLDKDYVDSLRMSSSYNANSFAREYMSIWSGSSEESWFNYDKITKYRRIKNPEWRAVTRSPHQFYLIAVDVGKKLCSLA